MNIRFKTVKVLILLLSLPILTSGCDQQPNKKSSHTTDKFKVGLITDSTLNWEMGVSVGARLFIEEQENNNKCGISELDLIFENSAHTPESSVMAVKNLIKNKSVDVIIGPNVSETAIPVSEIAESYKTPLITLLSTNNAITKNKSYVYQMALSNRNQAQIITEFLSEKKSEVAVIYRKSDAYSRNFARELSKNFSQSKNLKLEMLAFVNPETELAGIINKLLLKPPSYLVLPIATEEIIKFGKAVKDAGIKAQIIATDYLQVTEASKYDYLDGAFVFDHWHYSLNDHTEKYQFLVQYYKNKNEYTSTSAAFVVDALQLVSDYLCEDNTPSQAEFITYLNELRNFKGVTGEIYLFKNNKAVRDFYLIQIDGENTKVIKNLVQDK